MTEQRDNLEPTRENVWLVAKRLTQQGDRPPSLAHLRHFFSSPTSPAIAVYFSEWKAENASTIASLRNTKEQWKTYALSLEAKLERSERALTETGNNIWELATYLQKKFPNVWSAWQTFKKEDSQWES